MTQALERRPGADAPIVNRRRTSSFWPVQFYSTAVGKKWVMALTGLGLMGFVFVHMVGNLKMFLGRSEFDHYAEALRALLYPILRTTSCCGASASA
jgi:succinate dehydrogenase / fumarate reductase cytochrome b subunit